MTGSMKRVAIAAIVVLAIVVLVGYFARRDASSPTIASTTGTTPVAAGRSLADRMKATSSIAGHVRDDKQVGIAGARVCASGASSELPRRVLREPRCAQTDASGAYVLADLVGATYRVTALAEGRRPAAQRPIEIAIVTGEQRRGVDIVLLDGGLPLRGTVRDITGGPIAGALVANMGTTWHPEGFTVSDAAGVFTLWVPPGELWVSATADGYAPAYAYAAGSRTIEIVLTPASSISGTVVDVQGAPLAGIHIFHDVSSALPPEDITDEQGRFRVDELRPGRHLIVARGPRHFGTSSGTILVGLAQDVSGIVVRAVPAVRVSATVMLASTPPRPCPDATLIVTTAADESVYGKGTAGAAYVDGVLPGRYVVNARCGELFVSAPKQTIDVGASDVTGLRFDVPPGGALRGRVRTRGGEPVAGAHILLDRDLVALTDAKGAFDVTDLGPRFYDLRAIAPIGATPNTRDHHIEIVSGGTLERELVLDPASRLSGIVVDTAGTPMSGVRLIFIRHFDEELPVSNPLVGHSRDDGTFEVDGFTAHTFGFHILGGQSNEEMQMLEPASDVITPSPPASLRLKIVVAARSEVITGTVVDAANAPVPDAYVVARAERNGESAARETDGYDARVMTDPEGRFKLTGLGAGTHTVRAMRRGGGEAIVEHVAAGGTVKLQIKPTGSIEGTLRSRTTSVDDISVYAEQSDSHLVRSERLFFTQGRYVLRDLPAGDYKVVGSAGARVMTKRVTLAAGQTLAGVDLDLDDSVRVVGRVVDLVTREPMTGLSITASADVRRTVEAKTDANGRFVLEWLPPGPVSVDIWAHPLKGGSVVRTVLGSTFDLGEIALAKPGPDYMHRGELGITWKGDGSTVETGSERFEVEAVAPPAAGVLSVGDVVVSVNGIDVTGNNHEAGRTLFEVGPGTALRLGLASGKTVTVVAAK